MSIPLCPYLTICILIFHLISYHTGSTPTPIFRGNFLVADHDQAIGLLNGFVLEERMYAVLSLDVLGQVSVSLWNR